MIFSVCSGVRSKIFLVKRNLLIPSLSFFINIARSRFSALSFFGFCTYGIEYISLWMLSIARFTIHFGCFPNFRGNFFITSFTISCLYLLTKLSRVVQLNKSSSSLSESRLFILLIVCIFIHLFFQSFNFFGYNFFGYNFRRFFHVLFCTRRYIKKIECNTGLHNYIKTQSIYSRIYSK